MKEILKKELIEVARAYFMPVTFLWVLFTKGWTAAKAHLKFCWKGVWAEPREP